MILPNPFHQQHIKTKKQLKNNLSTTNLWQSRTNTCAREATFAEAGIKPPLGKPEIIGETKKKYRLLKNTTGHPSRKLEQISKSLSGIQGRIAKEGITDVTGRFYNLQPNRLVLNQKRKDTQRILS